MKRSLVLIILLTFGWVGIASALTFTDTQELGVTVGEGPYAQFLVGDTYSYTHETPADFEVPWDTVNSATLSISGYWIDSNNDQVAVEGTTVGTLTLGGSYFDWDCMSWDTPSVSLFNISSTFSTWATGAPLDVSLTADGSWGDGYLELGTSTFVLEYDNGTAPVPEPATLVLLGSGLAGLAFYRRKRK